MTDTRPGDTGDTGPEIDHSAARPDESRRDPERTRVDLEAWLRRRLPAADPAVERVEVPSTNGMSSETILVDAVWDEGAGRTPQDLVARIAPEDTTVPVFETYDLESQFRVMQLVAERSDVPVPEVLWSEPDPAAIGSPFFVMRRAHGVVPPDVLPYDFGDNWLFDAAEEDQRRLEESTVSVLARLHAIEDPERSAPFLAADAPGDTPLRRHVALWRRYYDWVTSDGHRSPLVERCFDWLEANWPTEEGAAVLSWGDARIGNVIYADFEPVAVLDWEMAGIAPREVDLGWMIFLHRFFEDIAASMGLPGMPHFLRRDRVAELYAAASGHEPRDLDFHTMYAALRHGVIMSQVQRRAIAFGQAEMPDDVDDLIMHRATLEAMLEGAYWDGVPT